jgi:hypothetical protein
MFHNESDSVPTVVAMGFGIRGGAKTSSNEFRFIFSFIVIGADDSHFCSYSANVGAPLFTAFLITCCSLRESLPKFQSLGGYHIQADHVKK